MEPSGRICGLNSNGPRTELCGTPQQMLKLPDFTLPRDREFPAGKIGEQPVNDMAR